MRAVALGVVLMVFGALAMGAPALAQDSDTENVSRARAHMERGQSLYAQARNLEAAAEFLAGYEQYAHASFLYNAGIAYERHGNARRAVQLYRRYLREAPNAVDADEVRERSTSLEGQVREQMIESGAITAPPDGSTEPPPTVIDEDENIIDIYPPDTADEPLVAAGPDRSAKSLVRINTDPEGAHIIVRRGDEIVVEGSAPFNGSVDPGDYTLTVEHPDFDSRSIDLSIEPGSVLLSLVALNQGDFTGMVNVVSEPAGARLFVDDREEGAVAETPHFGVLPVGPHHLWIDRPGYEVYEQDVEIGMSETTRIEVELQRLSYGRIRVTGNIAGATILIDGEEVGQVPYDGRVEPGDRVLTVQSDDMKDYEETIRIEPGQITPVEVELKPAMSRAGAWVTAVMGAAALGGGTALYLISRNNADELAADPLLVADDDRIFRGRVLTIGSYAAFGAGALFGVLAIYYFLRDDLPDSEGDVFNPRDWTVSASGMPGEGGRLMLQGSF